MKNLILIFLLLSLIIGCTSNQQLNTDTSTKTVSNEQSATVTDKQLVTSVQNNPQNSSPLVNGNGANVKEFAIEVFHSHYEPSRIVVNKNDKVRLLVFASPGTLNHRHGITIDEYHINMATTTEDPNHADKVEFIADKQGTFRIYCASCWDGPFGRGHPNIEMTLVVQ